MPIKKDEFEQPLKFLFPRSKILTAEKVRYYPKNIATAITHTDDEVQIEPALFNEKEFIEFKVLLSEYHGMTIDARIVGISKIQRVGAGFFRETLPWILVLIFSLFGLYKGGIGMYQFVVGKSADTNSAVGSVTITVITLAAAIQAFRNISSKRYRD